MKTREGIPEEDVDMMLEGEPFYRNKKSVHLKGSSRVVYQELLFTISEALFRFFSFLQNSRIYLQLKSCT
jgi:hypothetical protein